MQVTELDKNIFSNSALLPNTSLSSFKFIEMIPSLIIGFIVLVVLFSSFVTVSQGTIAVVTVFGKYRRILTPGLNFKIPLIEFIHSRVSIQIGL